MYHCVSHRFLVSDLLVFFVTIDLDQSNNYMKFDLQYISTPTLEATLFPLHKISKHQRAEQYQVSANLDEQDFISDVNSLATGKLWQSTTVYSQYE